MISSFSFKSSWHPIIQIVQCKKAGAARNFMNSSPQTEATTFAFSFVFILLLWLYHLPWSDLSDPPYLYWLHLSSIIGLTACNFSYSPAIFIFVSLANWIQGFFYSCGNSKTSPTITLLWLSANLKLVVLLKGQSNEIFDPQFFSSFKLVWATDQGVKIFSNFLLSWLTLQANKKSREISKYFSPPVRVYI